MAAKDVFGGHSAACKLTQLWWGAVSARKCGQSRARVRSAPYLIASHRSWEGLSVVTDTKAHRTTYGPLLYDA